jgi:TM2 domain-containing membrane protein YozV
MSFCAHCGAAISPEAISCPKCGQPNTAGTSTSLTASAQTRQLPYKSPGTAALIAIIGGIFGFMGIGHIYAGKVGKGIFILIGGIVLFFIGIFTLFILIGIPLLIVYAGVWIWQIFDARSTARKFNERVQATGKEPW